MAVVKGKRNQSDVEYFDYAYKVVEHITKFLLSDLGIKKTYRDLKVFAYKAHMEETDKEEFEHLVNKYDLELETDFPNWLMCYYRETLLTIMRDLINNISAAYISLQIVLLLYLIYKIEDRDYSLSSINFDF